MALKCAVVGMGGIGHTHARSYKNDELAELIADCDINKEKVMVPNPSPNTAKTAFSLKQC